MSRHFVLLRIVLLVAIALSLTVFHSPQKVQAAGISTYRVTIPLSMTFKGYPYPIFDIKVVVTGALTPVLGPNNGDGRPGSAFFANCPDAWGSLGSGGIPPGIGGPGPGTTITGYSVDCTNAPYPDTISGVTVTGTTFAPYVRVFITDEEWLYVSGIYPVNSLAAAAPGSSDIIFTDGRLNDRVADSYQSVAVYCENGGITAYALYQSKGYLAFKISKDELAKYPAQPAQNTLIMENLGVQLYKLTSGDYQISRTNTDGKLYTYRWKTC
jgi:hypothetical protein